MTPHEPAWPTTLERLPEVKTPRPMTAMEFKRLSSALTVIFGPSIPEPQYQKKNRWHAGATIERRAAGHEPLEPFHPIARKALPVLRSLT